MSRKHGSVTVTIEPDLREFMAALRRASAAAGRVIRSRFATLKRAITDPRTTHGPDMFTDDGRWQSTLCGAWLHGSCGLPDRCDCTCHGGTLR